MKDGLGNDTAFAFPEVLPDITEWASSTVPDPGTIVVTREGLRSLLQLVAECWPVTMGAFLHLHGKAKGPANAQEMYGDSLSEKSLADTLNKLSKVWCEGDLIVSRLFTRTDGTVIINPCAEAE